MTLCNTRCLCYTTISDQAALIQRHLTGEKSRVLQEGGGVAGSCSGCGGGSFQNVQGSVFFSYVELLWSSD